MLRVYVRGTGIRVNASIVILTSRLQVLSVSCLSYPIALTAGKPDVIVFKRDITAITRDLIAAIHKNKI